MGKLKFLLEILLSELNKMQEFWIKEMERNKNIDSYIMKVNTILSSMKLIKINEQIIIQVKNSIKKTNSFAIDNFPEVKKILTSELNKDYPNYCRNYFMIKQLIFIINKYYTKELKNLNAIQLWNTLYSEFQINDKIELKEVFYA